MKTRTVKAGFNAALRTALVRAALASLVLAAAPAFAHDAHPSGPIDVKSLIPGLGPLHHPVTTRNTQAQAWFDQGLRLCFAFNHEAAIQSFERAAQLDPDLAMAQWGIAYAYGPNINAPMDKEGHKAAWAAIQKAIALKPKASAQERAYIDAVAMRYSANPEADVAPLSVAYRDAMAALVKRYPRDVDAKVLYAESLMNLHPWKLWSPDGTPTEGTLELVGVLEQAMALQPNHMGALHFYIHAVEASPNAARALGAARRLENLAPAAGHLVHMPAHIYIRTGNYREAARVNVAAAKADERLIAAGVQSFYTIGYYGHNLHFLALSQAIAGNYAQAIAAANKLYEYQAPRVREVPPVDGFLVTPIAVNLQFERWDAILAMPEPPFEAPLTSAAWHSARALALAAKGRWDEARAEREKFAEAVRTLPKFDFGNNDSRQIVAVAQPYLDGRLALMAGNVAGAIASLQLAAQAEDKLSYDEPPSWYPPVREALGYAQLRAGDLPAAEATFREDLHRFPDSGRSLFGLQQALAAQGRAKEAAEMQARFDRAWQGADVSIVAVR